MTTSVVPSDLEIAQAADVRPILEIAEKLGLTIDDLDLYGKYKAKVHLSVLENFKDRPQGKYIDVTAITPTPLGEGKTTTSIGLTQALGQLGRNAIICIRQPSMGPTFGIKGGAAGGGYSQVIPMEDFNLHLTGDIHAISVAHNLVAAAIDTRMYHESRQSDEALAKRGVTRLDIDPDAVTWNRVVDVCDRSLRSIKVGFNDDSLQDGSPSPIFPRSTGYDITVASELMAILALTTGLKDLRQRVGRVVIGLSRAGKPVTLEDLGVAGAVTVLLKDAIMPNLMQTLENTPALVHAGPFANIAHGNASILADRLAMKSAEIVITEAGFGADVGAEKFFDIKCRASGFKPDAAVLVVTVRALKAHTGKYKIIPGKPLPEELTQPNVADVEAGAGNMIQHIENLRKFGVTPVVAINAFGADAPEEHAAIEQIAKAAGAYGAAVSNHFADGRTGAADLAQMVLDATSSPSNFRFLYDLDRPVRDKISTIAREIYRAVDVEYAPEAAAQIDKYEADGYGGLPICMAKTHLSFGHDLKMGATPKDFTLPIREVRLSAGAGFLYPLCGPMSTMPGLGKEPAAHRIDLDENGEIVGLF